MTGWAQVRYGYANNLEEETEKMRYDLYYIKNRSLWLDLRILFATVGIVLFGQDAARVRHPAPMGRDLSWPPARACGAKDIVYVPVLADQSTPRPTTGPSERHQPPFTRLPGGGPWRSPARQAAHARIAAESRHGQRRGVSGAGRVHGDPAALAAGVVPVLGQLAHRIPRRRHVAIGAYLLDRLVRHGAIPRLNAEVGIALMLVAWAVITLPVSYWVGGSVEVLTNQFMKAVAFFWLVGALTTTEKRLRTIAWTLVLCAIPLAATGIRNYFFGEVLTTGVPGLTRIVRLHGRFWSGRQSQRSRADAEPDHPDRGGDDDRARATLPRVPWRRSPCCSAWPA